MGLDGASGESARLAGLGIHPVRSSHVNRGGSEFIRHEAGVPTGGTTQNNEIIPKLEVGVIDVDVQRQRRACGQRDDRRPVLGNRYAGGCRFTLIAVCIPVTSADGIEDSRTVVMPRRTDPQVSGRTAGADRKTAVLIVGRTISVHVARHRARADMENRNANGRSLTIIAVGSLP